VVDGVMYFTEPPNAAHAVDAETGRRYWSYRRPLPDKINVCCGAVNRGLAILGVRPRNACHNLIARPRI
jgi:glucose dehydrogenase